MAMLRVVWRCIILALSSHCNIFAKRMPGNLQLYYIHNRVCGGVERYSKANLNVEIALYNHKYYSDVCNMTINNVENISFTAC